MKTLRFEYNVTLISLSSLVVLAWYYLFLMAAQPPMDMTMQNENSMNMSMETMSDNEMEIGNITEDSMKTNSMEMNQTKSTINFLMMPMTGQWTVSEFIVMFVMWTIMMFAMM